jgi:hypothetical protein
LTIVNRNKALTIALIEKLFPKQANNNYQGSVIDQCTFYLLMAMYNFRSFMHFLADDEGINSVAAINIFPLAVSAADPNNIICLLASLWGSTQILMLFNFFSASGATAICYRCCGSPW